MLNVTDEAPIMFVFRSAIRADCFVRLSTGAAKLTARLHQITKGAFLRHLQFQFGSVFNNDDILAGGAVGDKGFRKHDNPVLHTLVPKLQCVEEEGFVDGNIVVAAAVDFWTFSELAVDAETVV